MEYFNPRDDLDEPPFVQTQVSSIQQLYEGATVFITGATGFMSRIIMEKLLRTCNVGQIILMVRDKKGVKSQDRLNQIFNDELFETLKLQKPGEIRKKVTIVVGDCSLPDLGLCEADKKVLSDVNIVFHAAATLYFDQLLRVSFNINVLATKFLLEFAKTLPKLQAFIYVSTAFSQYHKDVIKEEFSEMALDADILGQLCNGLDDAQLGALTPKITGKCRSTYILTKLCAENLISKYDGILPLAVVRPSIVTGTWEEPVRGWINNIYGAVGVVVATALGILRVWACLAAVHSDMIPVDIASNMIIAASWEVATKNRRHAKIYNCVSSNTNPTSWNFLHKAVFNVRKELAIDTNLAIAPPCLYLVRNGLWFWIYTMWCHVIPAFFIDLFLSATGKKPRLLQLYSKIYTANKLLMPYCDEKEGVFVSSNVDSMWMRMEPLDQKLFNFDMRTVDWNEYWFRSSKGIRVYLLHDPMETVPQARRKMFWLEVRSYVFLAIITTSVMLLIYLIIMNIF